MKRRIKISDYPNIKKQIGRISVIISIYFIAGLTLNFMISAVKCLKEIEEWKVTGDESGYDIALSRNFLVFFVIGAGIGIILALYQIYRYNNIKTTRLGKSIWKYMEVNEDSYFENTLKHLDRELERTYPQRIKTGEIALTGKWLLGKGNFWRIDAVPIHYIQSIEAKLQFKIAGNASGRKKTYRSPALLITLKNGEIKGFFISSIDYGNKIVEKVEKRLNNEDFSDKYE